MNNKIYVELVNYLLLINALNSETATLEDFKKIAKYKVFLQKLKALKVSYAIPPETSNNSIEEVEKFLVSNAVKLFKLDYPITAKRQNTASDLVLLNKLHNSYKNELLATFEELTQLNISLVLPTTTKISNEDGINAPEITIAYKPKPQKRDKDIDIC